MDFQQYQVTDNYLKIDLYFPLAQIIVFDRSGIVFSHTDTVLPQIFTKQSVVWSRIRTNGKLQFSIHDITRQSPNRCGFFLDSSSKWGELFVKIMKFFLVGREGIRINNRSRFPDKYVFAFTPCNYVHIIIVSYCIGEMSGRRGIAAKSKAVVRRCH